MVEEGVTRIHQFPFNYLQQSTRWEVLAQEDSAGEFTFHQLQRGPNHRTDSNSLMEPDICQSSESLRRGAKHRAESKITLETGTSSGLVGADCWGRCTS